jgi:DNA invertase Pin-like site-specific DNA recombinase
MTAPRKNRPNAYSYVRWSSPQQAAGDSLRRQVERAASYAEARGLELVAGERWEDRGKSAFRGRNWHEGALGAFVAAIDAGDIPEGSFLLVEALDRISRDDVLPALNRMQEIIKRGITIVTCEPACKKDPVSG